MNRIIRAFAFPVLAAALTCLPTLAQDHPDQDRHDQAQSDHHENGAYRHHDEWKKGYHMTDEDWNRGEKVDYRAHHLRRPPEGHEWRQIDGNYVLATHEGIVASVQIAPHNH